MPTQYGGAGGSGNYFAIGAESSSTDPVTLSLSSEANYFGFWWSAGDVNNSITLLQNSTALATFTTANIVALLPNTLNGTVTAINGIVYNTQELLWQSEQSGARYQRTVRLCRHDR